MAGLLTTPLRAIDQWSNMVAATITDVNLPGFKLRRIQLVDGNVETQQLPTVTSSNLRVGGAVGIQFPDPSLNVGSTTVDFSQGNIQQTGISTDYSITDLPGTPGSNFFLLTKSFDDTGAPSRTVVYATRDGEFHWSEQPPPGVIVNPNFFNRSILANASKTGFAQGVPPGPYLVDSYGLYVIGARQYQADEQTTAGVKVGQQYHSVGIFSQGLVDPPPPESVDPVTGTRLSPVAPLVVNVKFPQDMLYSEYGANIFRLLDRNPNGTVNTNDVASGAASLPIATDGHRYYTASTQNPTAVPSPPPPSNPLFTPSHLADYSQRANVYATLNPGSLEQANYSLMPLFPEMSQIQKTFVSVSKIITVLSENMDSILNITR